MTNEELVQKIRQGEDVQSNMGILYEQNRGLIISAIKPLTARMELEDLLQESYFGLVKAVDSYDETKDVQFTSYLFTCVKGYCYRYVDTHQNLIRIPQKTQTKIRKYIQFIQDYQSEYHKDPDKETVMKKLEISESTYEMVYDAFLSIQTSSLSTTVKTGEGEEFLSDGTVSSDDVEQDVIDSIYGEQLVQDVRECLENLSEKERQVIIERYWNNQRPCDIVKKMGLFRTTIYKLEQKAMSKLKGMEKIQRIGLEYGYDCKLSYKMSVKRCVDEHTSPTEVIALKHIQLQEQAEECLKEVQFMQKVQERNIKDIRGNGVYCNKYRKYSFDHNWTKKVKKAEDLFSQIVNG